MSEIRDQQQVDQIRTAYEAWSATMGSPDSPTLDEFVASCGVTKATIYNLYRAKWNFERYQAGEWVSDSSGG